MARAGLLRERVRFEAKGRSSNVGGVVRAQEWTPLCGPYWARIRPLNGGETAIAERVTGRQVYEVELRSCADLRAVTADCRIVDARDARRTFAIIAPSRNPDERNRVIVFTCEQGPPNG
jgi:head-tail adaptor